MNHTVIFDLDGVIIDSEPVHFDLERQMFDELQINVSFKEHNSYVGTSCQNMWEMIVSRHNLPYKPMELVKKKYLMYMAHFNDEEKLSPISGVAELINELYKNNFKLAIASSSPLEVIDAVLKKFDLSIYFEAMISGAQLMHSKPHPEIFLRAAKLVGSKPGECVVIEDSRNGVSAAKAAGMKCIGFANANSGNQDLNEANVIIKSFEKISVDLIRDL